MCEKIVERCHYIVKFVPDFFKTQELFKCLYMLKYISDWLVIPKMIQGSDNDEINTLRNNYKYCKGQKAQIKNS